jgi:hypothetical protein
MAQPKSLRMNAYYYSFDPTGVREIDVLLSAVACAGKAYHHTDGWTEESGCYEDAHRGARPVDWIQNAADDAAAAFRALVPAPAQAATPARCACSWTASDHGETRPGPHHSNGCPLYAPSHDAKE